MRIETKNEALKLEFFKDLYESAKTALKDTFSLLDRRMRQYRGSTEIDGSDEEALTVRNITYEIVESQVSGDIPQPKTDAASYSERRGRNAETIERLCRSLRARLPFEELNDMDERYTYIYGGSVWYVDWDSSEGGTDGRGGVKIHCLSPRDFIPEPGIYSAEDMEYCFLRFTTTRGELIRRYGITEEESLLAECDFSFSSPISECDTVVMIVCFFRDELGEIGKFVFSGDLTLADLPRYYRRREYECAECKEPFGECACKGKKKRVREITRERLSEDVVLKSGVKIPALTSRAEDGGISLGFTEIPYYLPKSFPIVIRKNTSSEESLFGQSDCDYIRPEQQAINKIESRIMQKLLRAGITPIVPEDARVTLNNSVFGQVIKMKPGESASQYGKVDTTPDISQDIAEAERLYDHAKRVIGISDAYQGIDSYTNESGVARQLRISQASGRLESKKKMKYTAYASIDKLIFALYLAFADEPRHLSYKDAYGRIHHEEFNRYDFIEYDIVSGEYYYNDDYLFSVDLNGGNEYQREALWERNLDNLKAGTLGNPDSPVTLLRYWQCQERAHYPHARENVEYFMSEAEKATIGGVENEQDQFA